MHTMMLSLLATRFIFNIYVCVGRPSAHLHINNKHLSAHPWESVLDNLPNYLLTVMKR